MFKCVSQSLVLWAGIDFAQKLQQNDKVRLFFRNIFSWLSDFKCAPISFALSYYAAKKLQQNVAVTNNSPYICKGGFIAWPLVLGHVAVWVGDEQRESHLVVSRRELMCIPVQTAWEGGSLPSSDARLIALNVAVFPFEVVDVIGPYETPASSARPIRNAALYRLNGNAVRSFPRIALGGNDDDEETRMGWNVDKVLVCADDFRVLNVISSAKTKSSRT